MPGISIEESHNGKIDTADVLVRIHKKEVASPPPKRYAQINVLGTKKSGGINIRGLIVTPSEKAEQKKNINEYAELNFIGAVKLWNNDVLTQQDVDEMRFYGETLVVLSGQTAAVAAQSDIDFGQMIVWFTEVETVMRMDHIVKQPRRGVFIDVEKKGKALFALSRLLQNPDTLQYSTQINHTHFLGVTDINMAEQLDAQGYSYFFRSNELCWPRGFWVGGHQARAIYADKSVMYDIKYIISQLVQSGLNFNDETLAIFDARILQALKMNPFVSSIRAISIPKQKPSNKVKGLVGGVKVEYETANEVRTVVIELGGVV